MYSGGHPGWVAVFVMRVLDHDACSAVRTKARRLDPRASLVGIQLDTRGHTRTLGREDTPAVSSDHPGTQLPSGLAGDLGIVRRECKPGDAVSHHHREGVVLAADVNGGTGLAEPRGHRRFDGDGLCLAEP